jgi:hypothetical protein
VTYDPALGALAVSAVSPSLAQGPITEPVFQRVERGAFAPLLQDQPQLLQQLAAQVSRRKQELNKAGPSHQPSRRRRRA